MKKIKKTVTLKGTPLTALPNIGKITAQKLQRIDITTAEEFLARNPYHVFYELLHKVDPTLCKCALAGIVGARLNIPWHELTKIAAANFEKKYPEHRWKRRSR